MQFNLNVPLLVIVYVTALGTGFLALYLAHRNKHNKK